MKKRKLLKLVCSMSKYAFLGLLLQICLVTLLLASVDSNGQPAEDEKKRNRLVRLADIQVELPDQRISLAKAFKLLEEQTELRFTYFYDRLPVNHKVRLNGDIETMEEALISLSKQMELNFQRINQRVVVTQHNRKNEERVSEALNVVEKAISGTVIDAENDEPLVGATVTVQGTGMGTITDTNGEFNLSVPDNAEVLEVSYIGYKTRQITIGDQSSFEVSLAPDLGSLEEIVVVGYGMQKKSDVTGSIASTKEEDFNKGMFTNPGQLLQGKVAGVNINSASGEPGAAQDVIIRGIGSLRGTDPLYVIDGFLLDNSSMGLATNPLNFINPSDIKSIEILKDASATALYGTRASNGVIVITTKEGDVGETKMNLSYSTAWSNLANRIDVFNADEFRSAVTEAGGTLDDFGANTNWQDELTQTGRSHDFNFSMSGASSEKFSYFSSVGIQEQEGILQNSKLRRYSGRLNMNQKAFNGRLNVDYNLTASRTENLRPDNSSIVVDMLSLNPTLPVFNDNGSPTLLDNRLNPVVRYDIFMDEATNNRILASVAPSVELFDGLIYKLNAGVDYSSTNRFIQYEPYNLLEGTREGSLTTIEQSNTNQLIENTLTYTLGNGPHNADILAGHSYQQFSFISRDYQQTGFADNDVEPRFQDQRSSAALPTSVNAASTENELQSFFGRLNYSYDGKYLLTATIRADGSSKFGENNKYGYFPSFAVGWNISEEQFLAIPALDYLKIRASWGQTGNQEIPSKITQESFTESKSGNDTYPLDPEDDSLDDYPFGTIYTRLANPDLQWEVSTQTDIGLDFSLFGGQLFGTIDYFNKISSNILLEVVPADPIQVTSTFWTNIPDMEIQNEGIELSLGIRSRPGSTFGYTIEGNMSNINNKVINSPFQVLTTGAALGAGQTGATINGYLNNEPIGSFYMLRFDGIGEDGLNSFEDTNGDGAILENDREVVGTALPDFIYAFNLNLDYKNFSLGMNFNGVSGNKIYNHTTMSIFNRGDLASSFNTTDFALQYPEEAITNSNTVSTRYLESGDYLRLNNATLSYNLDPALVGLTDAIEFIRFSITGQNLFVLTDYSGFDPEVNTGSPRGGIKTFGIDRFTYPSARTFLLGVNIGF